MNRTHRYYHYDYASRFSYGRIIKIQWIILIFSHLYISTTVATIITNTAIPILLLLHFTVVSSLRESSKSPFRIVIDGGSTGSRLHIFEFVHHVTTNYTECIRRGSKRVSIPLSYFATPLLLEDNEKKNGTNFLDEVEEAFRSETTLFSIKPLLETRESKNPNTLSPTQVAQHLIPLFEYASQIIPSQYHSHTFVQIQATAGMRLLSDDIQEQVYDALYQGLLQHPHFTFTHMKRSDIGLLPGSVEALYGAVAANYLKGVVDVHLHMNVRDGKIRHYGSSGMLTDTDNPSTGTGTGTGTDTDSATSYKVELELDNDFHGPLGALDMGGASMQIVYLPNNDHPLCHHNESGCHDMTDNDDKEDNNDMDFLPDISHPNRFNKDEFFSVSYLSYGADQFRERLYNTFVMERTTLDTESKNQEQDDADMNSSSSMMSNIIYNPCSFKGYTVEWKGYILLGTGDAKQCAVEVNRLIPHHEEIVDPILLEEEEDEGKCDENGQNNDYFFYYYDEDESMQSCSTSSNTPFSPKKRKVVGGIQHPPVHGKFFAMSLFFFTLDCLRELSGDVALNASWPTPSISELTQALDSFCSREWYDDLELIQHKAHEFTRPEILPDRCFESVYIVTLLRDGFGFEWDSRDITFTYLVDGSEVEWSLGLAISHFAEEDSPAVTIIPSSRQSNHEEEVVSSDYSSIASSLMRMLGMYT